MSQQVRDAVDSRASPSSEHRWARGVLLLVLSAALGSCSDSDRARGVPPDPRAKAPLEQKTPSRPDSPAPAQAASAEAGAALKDALRDIARASATDLARLPNETVWTGGDASNGQALYVSHCSLCHGAGGSGDGLASAALNPKPRDFTDGTFYIDADANNVTGEAVDLARVIRDGPAAYGGYNAMVGWGDGLSDDEIRDLIAYIRTLDDSDSHRGGD